MELDFSKNIKDSSELQQIIAEQKTRKEIYDLPDSAFAHIEAGGRKVAGKTVPHSLRHFPVYNDSSLASSLAAVAGSSLSTEVKANVYVAIEAQAATFGVKVDEEMAMAAERYDGKKRSELEDSAFLDPKRRSFPVVSCKNVRAAVSTWGMYKGPMSFDEFKRKLTARAKKLGCESSLPKTWKDESSAKDWEKTDKKELKDDDKKEKKEHYKDAVKDDKDHIKKLEKDEKIDKKKESDAKDWDKIDKDELKHDNKKEKKEHYKDAVKDDEEHIDKLKKDEKIDKKKESEAASDKQKAARDAFMEMIKKKKGGDKDDKKSDDKDDKKSDDKKDKKSEDKKESKAADEDRDKKELDRDDKKEKAEHERDAIKDDKDQVDHLKEDEREDKKALKEDEAMMMKKAAMQLKEDEAMKMKYAKRVEDNEAMLKMKSRIDEIENARNEMEVEKSMTQKKLDAMMQKMRASDAP